MEGTGDMTGTVEDTMETLHQRGKETDHSLQQESRNLLNSSTMLIPVENDWRDPLSSLMSPEVFTDTLEGKILVRSASSGAGTESTFAMNNAGVIVEELTLNNYNGTNLSRVGCSNNREEMSLKKSQGQWHNLFQLTDGFGNGVSRGEVASKEPLMFRGEEAAGMAFLPKLWEQKSFLSSKPEDQAEINRNLSNSEARTVTSNTLPRLSGGIRTKVLPASGFTQFFVKNTLKGKGAIYSGNRAQPRVVMKSQNVEKETCDNGIVSDASQGSSAKANDLSASSDKANGLSLCGGGAGAGAGAGASLFSEGTSLREWLKHRCQKINKLEALHIFRQVVELIDLAHSQGVALQDLRPSSFLILPSNRVKYVGSWASQSKMEFLESIKGQDMQYSENHLKRKKCMEQSTGDNTNLAAKRQKYNEHMKFVVHHPGHVSGYGLKSKTIIEDDTNTSEARYVAHDFRELKNSDRGARTQNQSTILSASNQPAMLMVSRSVQLEERWYSCPEEINRSIHALSSSIYSLGVLLFELFCHFESWDVHAAAMSDLRHRILPPTFLSENPKEAGFCLWLLHPEPTFRPKTSEILQSELLSEVPDLSAGDQSSLAVDEEDAESELLLHFLLSLKEQKQKQASKLVEDLGSLRHDIDEVEGRHSSRAEYPLRKRISSNGIQRDRLCSSTSQVSQMKEARLMKNIGQLEHAYFSTRSRIGLSEADTGMRSDIDVLKNPSRLSPAQNDNDDGSTVKKPTDPLGVFFEGICRYARYSKFEVKGTLRNGDLLNSPNVICSLSFDRDEEYFAAAGVSKKIKVFEFGSLLNDTVDIHYPVIEMSSKSKLSCVCWNSYIKNHLASTDYDGVVQLWDASTGQGFMRYTEHQKRAWSVDFSQVDPTKLASGSDDCSVKLWTINEEKCISTIRNVANVCCVQFSSHSTHLLAFGSADYKIYCYDIRNTRSPWCTLVGHGKAVSYVKFLDSDTLVSASTDNTLKLWDLNKTTSNGLSTNACSLTLSGHTNEKNFVGLSVSDGYIACGSETNEVYAYYRSLPMPITPHKFGYFDPISGQETGDDNGQFVSSVCWRGKSNMVVAANSTGSIKLLQLV